MRFKYDQLWYYSKLSVQEKKMTSKESLANSVDEMTVKVGYTDRAKIKHFHKNHFAKKQYSL